MNGQQHTGLAAALSAFQAETPTFPKGKTAKVKSQRTGGEYTYKYADLGDILPVVNPLLAKHGLAWSAKPGCDEHGAPVLVYRLLHASGEADQGVMPLGVRADCKPQELGSAITYARRYALTAQLNLATDEDDDGQAAQKAQSATKANGSAPQPTAAPRTTAQPAQRSEQAASGAQKGKINALMGGASADEVKAILQWKCGTYLIDRVSKVKASELIKALREDGSGAGELLDEIVAEADSGDERAMKIVARYFGREEATNVS